MASRSILLNLISSGQYYRSVVKSRNILSDYIMRYILMNFIFVLGSLVLAAFVVQNALRGSLFDATVCAVMILIAAVGFIIARSRVNYIVSAFFSMISYELLCFLLIWNGDARGGGILFIFIFPLLVIFLLGMKTGIILACSQLIITAVQVFVPAASRFSYHFDISIRLVTVYILVLSITIVYERTRQIKDRLNDTLAQELKIFNDKLHDTFGRYLPDKVIGEMMALPNGPSLGGQKRYITIMTTDIRGFTPLAERYESESVVQLLNHYFSVMVDIINFYQRDHHRIFGGLHSLHFWRPHG